MAIISWGQTDNTYKDTETDYPLRVIDKRKIHKILEFATGLSNENQRIALDLCDRLIKTNLKPTSSEETTLNALIELIDNDFHIILYRKLYKLYKKSLPNKKDLYKQCINTLNKYDINIFKQTPKLKRLYWIITGIHLEPEQKPEPLAIPEIDELPQECFIEALPKEPPKPIINRYEEDDYGYGETNYNN